MLFLPIQDLDGALNRDVSLPEVDLLWSSHRLRRQASKRPFKHSARVYLVEIIVTPRSSRAIACVNEPAGCIHVCLGLPLLLGQHIVQLGLG